MNTTIFLKKKSIFLNPGKIFFSKYKSTMKPAITCLIIFASVFMISCSSNNTGAASKTDSATQTNSQRGEGESERGMLDSAHGGRGHGPNGMDTMHMGNH